MNISLSDHFTYKKLLRFTFPSIVMMILTSIYGVVDGVFVSNFVGSEAFASINIIMPFLMILGAIGFVTGTGGSAIIPVQTVANGKQFIRVQLQTGGNLYYTLPQNATFQGGKVYTYNIKVNLTDLEVTSSITDWTTDGDYFGDSNGEANM